MIGEERTKFNPTVPQDLNDLEHLEGIDLEATTCSGDENEIKERFSNLFGAPIVQFQPGTNHAQENRPLKVGVVFSGGQASGGHNVISGLFDALKEMDTHSQLFGFLGGPSGIVNAHYEELTAEVIDRYRNCGGFDLIGSGRTKIESSEQLQASLKTVEKLSLDGLVVIGGDDSNTNAAVLAQYFLENQCSARVVGVPKTIDGDLKNEHVAVSFGFDTACKCYAEMISNIERDAISAKKYYHFIRLMGRSASHIALECALKTHPNATIIGEEVKAKKLSLDQIVEQLCDMIIKRSEMNHNFGVILIPEGLIEFIPEMGVLIGELNTLLARGEQQPQDCLSEEAKKTFESIPPAIQEQLLLERDPHGNVQVSHIATEKLMAQCVKIKLANQEEYRGKFSPVEHFFGYEGRAAFPSNFDATYCTSLGRVAALLVRQNLTGYMAVLKYLSKPASDWKAFGVPIVSMMNMEERKGKHKPVIKKALVELNSKAFKLFKEKREEWMYEPCYKYVGAIQYFGPSEITDSTPVLVELDS